MAPHNTVLLSFFLLRIYPPASPSVTFSFASCALEYYLYLDNLTWYRAYACLGPAQNAV